ncbi:MAG: AraC family transcriptional regulator [Methanosphaera sp.]|uniref:helix-turn-helix domain-containing protein n=1 Tax=Methanosphaera sp. TaxID=2666342 RepID=UPI0025FF2AA0|nr:AraC family transcriptional regulator [Methanosphaera sp.]MCI5867624.1 AraC family transcriptional regulator [Methanosphaera sp.]MDD6534092.1 AraC family transcriptional regulator [Methanosphaera sp.]MDY3956099.1 AraC family transcriptional regulator [Methanosphaera sp.]
MVLTEYSIGNNVKIKDEYLQYLTVEKIVGGHKLIINPPYKSKIEIDYYNILPQMQVIETTAKLGSNESNYDGIFEFLNPKDTIIINCIIKGRCQVPANTKDKYLFLKDGDMNIYSIDEYPDTFNYGEGTHILNIILTKTSGQVLKSYLNTNDAINNLFRIIRRHPNLIYTNNNQIEEVLNQIINFNSSMEGVKKGYFRIKFLELMIHIYNFDMVDPEDDPKLKTFTDSQIRVVRKIKNMISRNIGSYASLDDLSVEFGINITTLKSCFKEMYGRPLYSWYRSYKFQRAKDLIENTNYPITKIASMIGYKNSSKFSKAFKSEIGVLPSAYRKNSKKAET